MSMIDLEPITSMARDWRVGQCVGKVTEAYAAMIYANKRRCELLNESDGRNGEPDRITSATEHLVDTLVDIMYTSRTMLWKLGLNDYEVSKAVNKGRARNGFYDY